MKRQQFVFAGVTIAVSVAILFAGRSLSSPRAEDDNDSESKVQKGFAIAPVPLNLAGKNRELVGLGSYLVNAVGDCNGCHSQGPTTQYTSNPYFRSPFFKPPKKVNAATYLGRWI